MAILTAPAPTRPAAAAPPSKNGRKLRDNLTGHAFLIGALLCFALFMWYPMIRGVVMSFQRTRRGETSWVGWDNYVRIVNDPSFWTAWKNTAYFTLLALVLGFVGPFLVAILLNEFRHAKGYLRILVYLPVMLPPASALFLFKFYAYDPSEAGLFNAVLAGLGLPTSEWMQSPTMTMPAMVIASTWMNMGGAVLIYLAALQNIPGELYEAAELDGAGILKRIWHVTIPQTKLILALLAMLQIVATMQLFIEPLILANGAGTQDSATSVVYLIYQHGFFQNDLNGAAALGVIMLLVLAVFSAVYVRLSTRSSED
ncbi:putative sugar ABC transporter permease protein [Actinoplanes missouriensis 431]|uniref:Putative sugar ABC transporter permease protein n=1 Tax=Actinoplanes missouriensis (strain ATCC 14538 / DSM 43046 / CBS 188.64 / JCM 3121 / NBRC 102363 / NCIMB 12654 / NRRL B-3342 / UNCC 431) TaxID=512565 RepID=I0HFM3_ACTM4|nr:sugar ABC transporter permease [Actinoplanes missouriensis]BAL91810.1 putative sugar ABC transporter permease protein [Actinoplanes missouriensis 431]